MRNVEGSSAVSSTPNIPLHLTFEHRIGMLQLSEREPDQGQLLPHGHNRSRFSKQRRLSYSCLQRRGTGHGKAPDLPMRRSDASGPSSLHTSRYPVHLDLSLHATRVETVAPVSKTMHPQPLPR